MVAHYWTGGAPIPRSITNISTNGAYIQASDSWQPGTVITLTLQAEHSAAVPRNGNGLPAPFAVRAVVVRAVTDGFAVQFLFGNHREKAEFGRFLKEAVSQD